MEVIMNKYQTPITLELMDSLPLEVLDQLFDVLNNVEFIRRLISPARGYAKDRPRDKEGKIIVDLANPHILENMDYFRPSALAYKKNGGMYTLLRPNANPNSEYGKWIREEKRRCWEGYVRPSDGEWVPGPLYFYMNYCPIIQSKIRKGTKQADRIIDFPEMWEGIYWRFHYMDLARNGGIYNEFLGGNHGAELASRGKAFAYSLYVETPEGRKKWEDIHIGDSLFSIDGSTTKVINIPFDDKCEVYKVTFNDGRLVLTTKLHLWKLYKNGHLWNKLYTTEEVMNHNRVTRFAIPKVDAIEFSSKDTLINPYLLGLLLGDGSMTISSRNRAQFTSTKEDVIYYLKELNMLFIKVANNECGWLIPCNEIGTKLELLGLKRCTSIDKFIPKDYLYNSKEVRYSILKGLLDTDGSVHSTGKPEFYTISKQLADDVAWLCRSLGYIASIRKKHTLYKKGNLNIKCKDCYIVYIQTNDKLFGLERKNLLCGNLQGKNLKQIYSSNIVSIEFSHIEQCKCVTVDRDDGMFLIGDFIPTHNSKSYSMASILNHNFILGENSTACREITSIATAYLKEYLIKDGVLNKFISMANFCSQHTQFPRKRLKQSLLDMVWVMGYRDVDLDIERGTLNQVLGVSSKDDESKLRGKRAAFIGVEEFGTFPRLIDLYNVMLPSVQEGDYVFGLMYLQGTAGDNESDFAGALEIMYNPKGYNMYALPNVFDKNNQGKKDFVFFFPGYVNRKGCYNKDGVSDVVLALVLILMNRYRVKYNSTDPNTVIKTIAEVPITPAEAIVKTGVNMFPVTDLTERLGLIDNNPSEYDDVYVGELVINKSGEVEYKPTTDKPIREFPHKDNKIVGAIEMFLLPKIDKSTNKPYANRYILGCLKEGELINTDSGLKKVEVVTLQDKLINTDGNFVSIKNCQRYYNSNPVYKVKLSNIYDSTTFSEEHPIYCTTPKRKYRGKVTCAKTGLPQRYYDMDFLFRRVADLKVGDYVKSPIPYKEVKYTDISDPDIWYLIGVILGDGWANCNNHNINIAFNSKEQCLISKVLNIVETKLHRKFSVVKDVGTCKEYSFCSSEFNKFISDNFGRGATKKHIPENFKYLPYDCRKSLILGYIDTDGCISNRGIEIVSVSKVLLNDIQDLLFSLKIVSSIKLLSKEDSVLIMGKECHASNKYELLIGLEGVSKIKSWTYNSMKVGNFVMPNITNHNRKYVYIDDDYIYLRVNSIDIEEYTGYVYNFECETHTFMCNYIPTHNCDPYDDDESDTMSLGSVWVLDLWTDSIVAEYTGRPMTAEEFYEICRRMCLFYNGRMNYENNKKGLFGHFSSRNSLYLLTDILDFLKDKQMMKEGTGNKAKGTNASAPINAYARNLLRSWLLKPVPMVKVIDGEEQLVMVPNLYTIRSRALLKELINYNTEGNFDRISAMGMLMLLRLDKMILYQNNISQIRLDEAKSSYLGNDPFFKTNYDNRFKGTVNLAKTNAPA